MPKPLIAAIAATCLFAPAVAQPVTFRAFVSAAGLDLGTPRGRAVLDRRIARAAVRACGPTFDFDLVGSNAARRCAAMAAAAARPQRDRLIAATGHVKIARP